MTAADYPSLTAGMIAARIREGTTSAADIVRASFARARGVGAEREALNIILYSDEKAALAEADSWLEMSGAKSYEPFLNVERAELARLTGDDTARERELREAHRLFIEMGATGHVDRLAKELGL